MQKPRVVVDTNIFISGLIISKGYPYQILSLWQDNYFTLVASKQIIDEMIDVLSRPKIQKKYHVSTSQVKKVVSLIEKYAHSIENISVNSIQVRDEKDQHILDLAIVGKADYLVSGDDDLLSLANESKLKKLKIVTPREFMMLFSSF